LHLNDNLSLSECAVPPSGLLLWGRADDRIRTSETAVSRETIATAKLHQIAAQLLDIHDGDAAAPQKNKARCFRQRRAVFRKPPHATNQLEPWSQKK
jgi:hypothetical protein